MNRWVSRSAIVLAVLVCAATAWAQATASITGTVRDQSGAVLPGVTVTATQTDTGLVRTVVSNGEGQFNLPNLPLGPYQVEATLDGFRTFLQTGVVLNVNSAPVVNPVMTIGQLSDEVRVTGTAQVVETRSNSV